MRAMVIVVLMVGTAAAEPVRAPSCDAAGTKLVQIVAAGQAGKQVALRCERDRWSAEARTCFALAATGVVAQRCLDTLSKDQRNQLAGEIDRVAAATPRRALAAWIAGPRILVGAGSRMAAMPMAPRASLVTLAVATDVAPDARSARSLHDEGMTAYRAGRFDVAVKKLSAANASDPSPELAYHLAQAYRLKGDRRAALDMYERYIELAPDGAAAADCRFQIDQLGDL